MRRFALVVFTVLQLACGDERSSASTMCTPGEVAPCFSGEAAMVGVGVCRAGLRVCAGDGLGYGACQDEIGPSEETCTTAVDDDCDGEVNESGEDCACVVGDTVACYSGPAETQSVGLCADGTQTCLGIDDGLGPCVGEVLPEDEVCGTVADESCDGSPYDGCPGEIVAIAPIPEGSVVQGIVAHPDGGIIATGFFEETIDLGGGALVNQGGTDAFIARYGDDGAHLWSRAFGGLGNQGFGPAILPPTGGILVNTYQAEPADYGGGLAGGGGFVLLDLDEAGGYLDHDVYGATLGAGGVAADAFSNGDRLLTFSFTGEMVVGGETLSPPGGYGTVTGRMSPTGTWVWSKAVFSDLPIYANVWPHSAGGAVIAILFEGSVELDGTVHTSLGGYDTLLVRVDADGQVSWTKPIAGPGSTSVKVIAPSPGGETSLFVIFEGWVDLGGGPFLQRFSNLDVAFARVDAEGNHLWSKQLASATRSFATIAHPSIAPLTNGFVGAFYLANGTLDLGGGEIDTIGADLVIASIDDDGLPRWFRHGTTTGNIYTYANFPVAVDAAGGTWFFVGNNVPLHLGGGEVPPGHHIVKLAP